MLHIYLSWQLNEIITRSFWVYLYENPHILTIDTHTARDRVISVRMVSRINVRFHSRQNSPIFILTLWKTRRPSSSTAMLAAPALYRLPFAIRHCPSVPLSLSHSLSVSVTHRTERSARRDNTTPTRARGRGLKRFIACWFDDSVVASWSGRGLSHYNRVFSENVASKSMEDQTCRN